MLVKICGITSVEDAEAAIAAGADALGLCFVPSSARGIEPERARVIAECARGRALRVGVFQNAPLESVRRCAEAVGLDVVQLHGDEDSDYAAAVGLPVIKALAGGDDLEGRAARFPGLDLLVDHPKGGGGHGEPWEYAQVRSLVSRGRRVWLAGGLGPQNVGSAVLAAHPHGVDASSGLESEPGRKAESLMRGFVEGARAAEAEAGRRDRPDARGYFGRFGGCLVPELLVPAVQQLAESYEALREDPAFWEALASDARHYVGRPTPLYLAERVSDELGLRVYFKREDLAHTGAHKINNALGQVQIARRMGKRRVIAETGAGQHGVATATACAKYGIECEVYMGAEDVRRQELNVFRMELLGARVHPVHSGSSTLKDAMNEALRDWATNVRHTYYVIGSAAGPHPYPMLVRDLQSVIGREARAQIRELEGVLPDLLIACVGGGSNAIGLFHPFHADESVAMWGAEAGGEGPSGRHGASLTSGSPGALHGSLSYVLQDDAGQILHAHSISAGLDYPGVGPEHAFYKESGRARYFPVTDAQALDAFGYLARMEGLIPAFESSHAVALLRERAAELPRGARVVVGLSGRGDKDVAEARRLLSAEGDA